jgi:hypothetical protein
VTDGALGRRHDLRDRDRGRVARKNGRRLDDGIDGSEHLSFFVEIFDDGFDDEIAIGEILLTGCALQAREDCDRRFGDRAFRREFIEGFADRRETFLNIFLVDFQDGYIEPSRGGYLSDSGTHQAATEHAYFFNFHRANLTSNELRAKQSTPS